MTREEFADKFGATLTRDQVEMLEMLHSEVDCPADETGYRSCCVDLIVDARRPA